MATTAKDLIDADAVAMLCYYADTLGGKESDWATVREFAVREWRDCPYEEICKLIETCRKAYSEAQTINMGDG